MTDKPVIEVADLRVDYGDFTAVDGISFEVRPGEIFALLGTNGAGKTSTLDVLEGYLSPSSGRVSVLGVDPAHQRNQISHRVGIMLQDAGLFDDLSVAETVRAWQRFHPAGTRRADPLEDFGLQRLARTRVRRLSGGERRSLELCLALLGRPDVLFLDEPTTGLDAKARRETWARLRALTDDGLTVLLTTHYMEEAEYLADRVAIMDRGHIVRSGGVAEVVSTDRRSRISFRVGPSTAIDDIPPIPGAQISQRAGLIEIDTDDLQRVLGDVLRWADAGARTLTELNVRSSSLEDVFLDVANAHGGSR